MIPRDEGASGEKTPDSGDAPPRPERRRPPERKWNYPAREEHPGEEIFIHRQWCKSCGICYSMCPRGVLTSDKAGRPVVSDPELCIACGLCEILCPDMAITVYRERGGGAKGSKGPDRSAEEASGEDAREPRSGARRGPTDE